MSTGRLLPGFLKTSIQWICSLQVCEINPEQIYLAVSGSKSDYTENKTEKKFKTNFNRTAKNH